ncbi:ANTAR domain protein [Sphingobium phage Lacusarx]|uniref:ANTAR domain protein n=1 Tax=Sphingobium phage Lacusarx TaxID=1980139 RepID=A0A1W6DXH9_9CAUD|nr:ANTAR domain protein [Sphingobium phage Lacusarx]ARK07589.1 ANTAR domain protein [Sphingobium phage Lacusarx]
MEAAIAKLMQERNLSEIDAYRVLLNSPCAPRRASR